MPLEEDEFYELYKTHQATQDNLIKCPDDVDEDGYSESLGDYFNTDYAYTCDYCFVEIKQ